LKLCRTINFQIRRNQMKDENKTINITFRVSPKRKKQLEFLSGYFGKSISQFFDDNIRILTEENLYSKGDNEAFIKAAKKAGVHPAIAEIMAKHRGSPEEYKKIIKPEVFEEIYREYEATKYDLINALWKEYGIENELTPFTEDDKTYKDGELVDYFAVELQDDLEKALKRINIEKDKKRREKKKND